jgi:hypothetical protein
MAGSYTPYTERLQPETFHDSDEIAAGWRLFAAQIENTNEYIDIAGLASALHTHYRAYVAVLQRDKRRRFTLDLHIGNATDISALNNYHAALSANTTQRQLTRFNNLLAHLESTYSVSHSILSGISLGNISMSMGIESAVIDQLLEMTGGSSAITEIPKPSLAGQYKPNNFPNKKNGNGNGHGMAFRRRRY